MCVLTYWLPGFPTLTSWRHVLALGVAGLAVVCLSQGPDQLYESVFTTETPSGGFVLCRGSSHLQVWVDQGKGRHAPGLN